MQRGKNITSMPPGNSWLLIRINNADLLKERNELAPALFVCMHLWYLRNESSGIAKDHHGYSVRGQLTPWQIWSGL